jgi:hypothetical protein
VVFDDFHAYWIGLFVLLAIIVLEWLFGELVVCCHPRLRPVFEMLSTLRTEVTVDALNSELVLPTEDPSAFSRCPAPIEGLATDRAVHASVPHCR